MRLRIAIAALGLTLLAGCGGGGEGEGTIPPENAKSLLDQLDGIGSAIDDQDCTKAQTDTTQFVVAVNELPEETGVEVKELLREAGQNLDELVASECEDTGVTGETDVVETTSTPEETVTPPVEPVAPPTDEASDEEQAPEQPADEGGTPPSEDDGDSGGVGEGKRRKPKPDKRPKERG